MKSNLIKRLAIVISLALICTSFAIPSFADTVKNSDSMYQVNENGTYTTEQTNTAVKKETFTSPSRTSNPSNNPLLGSEEDIWNYIFEVGFNKKAKTEPNYLTFTAETAGSTITFKYLSGTAEYSTDGGNTWTACELAQDATGDTITLTNTGDSVCFKGNNVTTGLDSSSSDMYNFSMTGQFKASGDVTSLTNGVGGDVSLTDGGCYSVSGKPHVVL